MSGKKPEASNIVIGAGAWGTALAIMLAQANPRVILVARSEEKSRTINNSRENTTSLPGIRLPETLRAVHEAGSTLRASPGAHLLLAVPTQECRGLLRQLAADLLADQKIIMTAKGLERGSRKLLHQIVEEETQGQHSAAILSGPSFAHDVARGLPTAVTLAAATMGEAESLANALQSKNFRPYASDDRVGVQLGGALKNVLAIAAGIVEGLGLGESAKAALISRGFAELSRLSISQGARPETLTGLSGLGDLVLTCSTAESRNFLFGQRLGRGTKLADLLADRQPLAEGARTASAALALGREAGIELPITATVAAIIEDGLPVSHAVAALLARPLTRE